jgi:hypothetical protein
MNFVIYAYDMLFLFLSSLSLSIAQLYMLHIIDSCDNAGAWIIDGEEVLCQEYIYDEWPECQAQVLPVSGFRATGSSYCRGSR